MTNFEQFYITWYSRAIYFAREYILSESDAENIVQDVFLHLYEHCDRLDAYTNLTAYLFTSIKNKCLDYLRKRVNEQEAVAEMQSEFDMALRMKYDSLEILNTNFPDETGIEERLKQALQKRVWRTETFALGRRIRTGFRQTTRTPCAAAVSKELSRRCSLLTLLRSRSQHPRITFSRFHGTLGSLASI